MESKSFSDIVGTVFSNSMFLQLVLLMSEKDDADKGFGRYSLVWEAKCWNVTSASTQKSFIRNRSGIE
jgi:hypothetical protein